MRKILLSVAVFAPLFTQASFAESSSISDNIYIGAKSGWVYFSNGCESHNIDCDKDELGGGAFIGYQLMPWLSLEVGYDYFGKAKAVYPALNNPEAPSYYSAKVQGVEAGLKASYGLTDNVDIFGKGGALYWQVKKTGLEGSQTLTSEEDDVSLMVGAGLAYRLTDSLKAQLEYQWFDNVGGRETGGSNVNFTTLGLVYSFGSNKKAYIEPVMEQKVAVTEVVEEAVAVPLLVIDAQNDKALFGFDSFSLSAAVKKQLAPLLEHLQAYPDVNVQVIGYTDAVGRGDYNDKLSYKRAKSVADYLEMNGVDSSRISLEGRGARNPIATNHTEEGRSKNRRVEIYASSVVLEPSN
ncbi:OmpA family protein [Vibrio cholerae]|nr:OmpA family protein [Vibrio cholerae]